jgi:hypothetical protein
MSEIEHDTEMVEQWPDGSKITVDRWRFDPVGPWIYGNYEVHCGTCGEQIAAVHGDRNQAFIRYFAHAIHELQVAMMELSYRIGRGRVDGTQAGTRE